MATTTTTTTTTAAPPTPSGVSLPEMDLTVTRDEWPSIIERTTGHLLAYGWPGTGKSYDFAAYSQSFVQARIEFLMKNSPESPEIQTLDYYEVNCTRQTSAAGWLGHWIDGGAEGFKWNYGPVALAMLAGVPIVINDIHLCSDDLYDLLYFVLDSRGGAKYSLPNGIQLSAKPGFRALMSLNGDPLQILDEPIRSRIVASFEINQPSRQALRTLDKDVRPICRALYQAAKNEPPKFDFRTFQHFCQLRRELGDPFKAARLATGDEESARALIEPVLMRSE